MSEVSQLLGEIAHCSIANEIRSGNSHVSIPCREIVSVQTGVVFQLPEPWSGQIDIAPLLFISSNPSLMNMKITRTNLGNPLGQRTSLTTGFLPLLDG